VFARQSLRFRLQVYRACRRLQDHESIERGDAAIAAHIPSRVGRAAAGCDLERDNGVCGGERWCWRFIRSRGACGASVQMLILTVFLIRDTITERPPDRASAPMAYLCNHLSNLYIVQNTLAAGAESCV